jgi:uncharacterized protein YifN (PemK superfamily)
MPISFVPEAGQILMCDFTTGFVRPEMEKIRHCVVVSPRRHTGCCLIIPVSTVRPDRIMDYHFLIPGDLYRCFDRDREQWAKCDMLTHAGLTRLDRVREDHRYVQRFLRREHLLAIRRAIVAAVGLTELVTLPEPTKPLTAVVDLGEHACVATTVPGVSGPARNHTPPQ